MNSPTLEKLKEEYIAYRRNAQRCGFWPWKPLRIMLIEHLLVAAGKLELPSRLQGQPGREGRAA